MKKALVILLALCMVGFAFAGDPAPELKVTEFTGSASVTLGADCYTGAVAFSNSAAANIRLDIMGAGDKITAGENIWGELKIKTDGDPVRIKADSSAGAALSSYKVIVDVAKLNFGTMGYVGIKSDGTVIDYAGTPNNGAAFYKVDPTLYYGVVGAALFATGGEKVGFDAANGFVAGLTLANLLNATLDIRTPDAWATDLGPFGLKTDQDKNRFGVLAKVDLKAVENLTFQAGFSTGFGGKDRKYDLGFGGKVGYTIKLNDTMSINPVVAVDAVQDVANATNNGVGTEKLGYVIMAGATFGWAAKAKSPALYFIKEADAYPGVSVGMIMASKDVFGEKIGMNVSFLSGAIVPNLTAAAALEVLGLEANAKKQIGFSAVGKYSLAMDPMTIVPKFGLYYYSNEAGATDQAKSDIYVKAGVEVNKVFPNTSLSFDYASNDFNGGVGNQTTDARTLGMVSTTLKIAF